MRSRLESGSPAFRTSRVRKRTPVTLEDRHMMSRFIPLAFAALTLGAATSPSVEPVARDVRLVGRWDITITTPTGNAPSWLEIDSSGREALVGRIVGIVGSVRPISE